MSRLWRWLPIILYSGLIFYLSSGSVDGVPRPRVPGFDKVLHSGAFFLWSLLGALALSAAWPRLPALWFVAILTTGGALYGLSDELHQAFVPDREVAVLDWVADCLGAFIGAVVAALIRRRLQLRAAAAGGSAPGGEGEGAEPE